MIIQELLDHWQDIPFMLDVCNPSGVELPDREAPVLYSGNSISFLDGLGEVRLARPSEYESVSIVEAKEILTRHNQNMHEFDQLYSIGSARELAEKADWRQGLLKKL